VTADILEGITRATVIQLAEDLGIETQERPVDRSELYVADEAFLCGYMFSVGSLRLGALRPGAVPGGKVHLRRCSL
jgi:branched-subunit amino acid aminotransferase/4-amino-4-deoxychorismate lyase